MKMRVLRCTAAVDPRSYAGQPQGAGGEGLLGNGNCRRWPRFPSQGNGAPRMGYT